MMECQICGDTQGPWEYEEIRKGQKICKLCGSCDSGYWKKDTCIMLVCEDCGNVIRKERKHDTTNIRNKRHGSGISRTNGRSKRRTDDKRL